MVRSARTCVSLQPYVTLRTGGNAERLAVARSVDELADWAAWAQVNGERTIYLGLGSNVLPSDDGVPGLVIVNQARRIEIDRDGSIAADAGCAFQELFLKSAQASLTGLEFAVGIPGTLGGALVSNAGAYRSCISDSLVAIEVVENGVRRWVEPSYMAFSYRNSVLRRENPPNVCLLRVKLSLDHAPARTIYDRARDYQRQRIGKQPPCASAGSFFKNVENFDLAQRIPGLTDGMRANGVIPSGFLIEAVGLKGFRFGGAMLSRRHANFILNVDGASASVIRSLAEFAGARVEENFGVKLEEEVLYLGDWSRFSPLPMSVP